MPYRVGDHDVRPWGMWQVLSAREGMVIKQITVLPGQRLSLQRHRHRREDWIITAGTGIVTLGEIGALAERSVTVWNSVTIDPNVVHRIENPSPDPLVFVEVQSGELLDEGDIERLADDYNRSG